MTKEELNKHKNAFLCAMGMAECHLCARGWDKAVETLWPEFENLEAQKKRLIESLKAITQLNHAGCAGFYANDRLKELGIE